MSAFSISRQVNSSLSFKHWLRVVPGKAGGAAMAAVDHPLILAIVTQRLKKE
jgi:hypothetical protein